MTDSYCCSAGSPSFSHNLTVPSIHDLKKQQSVPSCCTHDCCCSFAGATSGIEQTSVALLLLLLPLTRPFHEETPTTLQAIV